MTKKLLLEVLLFLLVVAAICYVPLRSYKQNGTAAAFAYFTPDAFYYLNVADKSAHTNFYTYDGENPTNGFHPLWEYFLTSAFHKIPNSESQLLFTFFFSMFITALGFGIINLALGKIIPNIPIRLLALLPGYFYILFSFILSQNYAPWSYVNGMESGFSIFSLGILLVLLFNFKIFEKPNIPKIVLLSFSLALIGFSRLDDFFMLFAFIIGYYYFTGKNRIVNISYLLLIPFILIVIYLLYNLTSTGLLLPVSGTTKNTFYPVNFLHLLNFFTYGGSINDLFGHYLAIRALPLAFSMFVGFFIIFNSKSVKFASDFQYIEKIFYVFAMYLILKGLYNLLYVDFWNQGPWYFVDSITLSNIILCWWLANYWLIVSHTIHINFKKTRIIAGIIVLFFIIIYMNGFIDLKRFGVNEQSFNFWNERTRIEKDLKKVYMGNGIVEFDDGIMAYSLGEPCLSGMGLELDREAIVAKKAGRLLDLAYSRGYRAIASLNYFFKPEFIPDSIKSIKDFTRKPFFAFDGQDVSQWKFKTLFKDQKTGAIFIGFERK